MGTQQSEGEALAPAVKRVKSAIEAVVKRRSNSEPKVAGAARVLAPFSPTIRNSLATAATTLVRRQSADRPLYVGALRTLAEVGDKRAPQLLCKALAAEDFGGVAALSAACFCGDPTLSDPLARAALARQAHVSFAAEVARLARGEQTGPRLLAMAPKIKESHRIGLCVDVFLPLLRGPALSASVAPALEVLRGAERHLGRWLILAEIARRAGDPRPLAEAEERSTKGPQSAKAAWAFVAWALDDKRQPPSARPTVELVARLSDRPSADRDTSFLFRLAGARIPTARAMLESMVKQMPLSTEQGVRAAGCLARGYGRDDLVQPLLSAAKDGKREEVRGFATAALWDAGARDQACDLAAPLQDAKLLSTQVWAALVMNAKDQPNGDIVREDRVRRLQWGWVD